MYSHKDQRCLSCATCWIKYPINNSTCDEIEIVLGTHETVTCVDLMSACKLLVVKTDVFV